MMEKTTKYTLAADAFHCDFQHRLSIGNLGNNMLNAADIHSSERHFGMTYLNTMNKTWVLSRLAIELEDMPQEHDRFTIETWVESAMKYFTRRNWAIYSEDGQKTYGYGKSIWAMIDTATRTPQDIMAINGGSISEYVFPEKNCPIASVSRVTMPAMTEHTDFQVKYSDIDVNGHCNSMKYIDHIMDTFTRDYHSNNRLKRIEIAYVAEAYWGETIRIYHESEDEFNHNFRLMTLRNDTDETELCRMKTTFVSTTA